ncbi:MAG: hypothetical protein ABIT05_00040 [Chitinophagaceae bacterium]
MERLLKFIVGSVFISAGIILSYRYFFNGTNVTSKLSNIKIEPYYPEHKDSSHYVVTFQVTNYKDRLAVYIGNQEDVKNSDVVHLLDTLRFYTINFDEMTPTYDEINIGVRKIVAGGKVIYKNFHFLRLLGGICAFGIGLFFLAPGIKRIFDNGRQQKVLH